MTVSRARGAKAKADTLFSKIIRSRGRCERCGRTDMLVTAHILSRRYSRVRVDPSNAWCLDASCHYEVDNFPDEKMRLVEQTIGLGVYERVRTKALDGVKVDWIAELEKLRGLAELLGVS